MTKAHPALAPFAILGRNVIGDKDDLGSAADELVLPRLGFGGNERESRAALGRRDGHPALASREEAVEDQVEAELIDVEPQGAILIAHEDVDGVDA